MINIQHGDSILTAKEDYIVMHDGGYQQSIPLTAIDRLRLANDLISHAAIHDEELRQAAELLSEIHQSVQDLAEACKETTDRYSEQLKEIIA